MADDLLQASAWKALERHADELSGSHLRDLLDQPGRFAALSRQHDHCLLDFSRNRLTTDTLKLLIALASEREVPRRIQALFAGEVVNATENRPAQHMALRAPASPPLVIGGTDIRLEIRRSASACWRWLMPLLRASTAELPVGRFATSSTLASAVRTSGS